MKELARNEAIGRILVKPGDTLRAWYDDKVVGEYQVTESMTLDTLLIVQPEQGELGLSGGIGAIFGTKDRP